MHLWWISFQPQLEKENYSDIVIYFALGKIFITDIGKYSLVRLGAVHENNSRLR